MPLMLAIDPFIKIGYPPSLKSGMAAFCTVNSVPRTFRVKSLIEMLGGHILQFHQFAQTCTGKQHIDLPSSSS